MASAVFVNKDSLEYIYTHLFTYCSQLLSRDMSSVEEFQQS